MKAEEFLPHVHPASSCKGTGPCPFHDPSDHHMVDWDMTIRFDRLDLRVDRICAHHCQHPDPDSVSFIEWAMGSEAVDVGAHDCDGCCRE